MHISQEQSCSVHYHVQWDAVLCEIRHLGKQKCEAVTMLLKAGRAGHQDPASPWSVAGYMLTLARTSTQHTSGSWFTGKRGLWTTYTVFSYTRIITWNLDILIHNRQQGSWSTCSKVWGLESKPTLLPFAAGLGDLQGIFPLKKKSILQALCSNPCWKKLNSIIMNQSKSCRQVLSNGLNHIFTLVSLRSDSVEETMLFSSIEHHLPLKFQMLPWHIFQIFTSCLST